MIMNRTLRYACIGAGGIARKKHLETYSKLNEIENIAICDDDIVLAQHAARQFGFQTVYKDYRQMLNEQNLDLISICTPNFLHVPMTIAALEHGVNVHCEKPLAIHADDVASVLAVREVSGKKMMVGLNNRFTPEFAHIQALNTAGFFGDIYQIKCGWERNFGIPGIGRWYTRKAMSGGGPLIDLGVHFLDMAFCLTGFQKPQSVFGATYAHFQSDFARIRPGYCCQVDGIFDVEDAAAGMIRLESGTLIEFNFSWASNIEKERKYLEIYGTQGGLTFIDGEIRLTSLQASTLYNQIPDKKTLPVVPDECRHFIDCILSDRPPLASAEQALLIMQTIDAIYQSAAEKREIRLG